MSESEIKRVNRVVLAERFGWTLEYVDSLSPRDLADVRATINALDKFRSGK